MTMRNQGQQKIIGLNRGLYMVQYKSAEDETAPPKVLVSACAGFEDDIEFVLHPDAEDSVLWQPETCLIVRIFAESDLAIEVKASRRGGSQAAVINVEPVVQGQPPAANSSNSNTRHRGEADGRLSILGHVAGRGDLLVGPNEWIAGPDAPARVEGLELRWPGKPADIDIQYAVKIGGSHAKSSPRVGLGEFVGTRGRALPLTGVTLDLSSKGSQIFVAEALFLNSPVQRAQGRKVVLSGPTGREPLVGLRIDIESEATTVSQPTASRRPASGGRVRVFRSRPKQDVSAG
jgi:hypothetical protein